MAIFSNDLKDILKRLANKEFSSSEERDELLARLASQPNIRARDVTWMLFRPDRAIRDTGISLLRKLKDPETVDLFLGECKTKPEAAVRAASGHAEHLEDVTPTLVGFAIGIYGLTQALLAFPSSWPQIALAANP